MKIFCDGACRGNPGPAAIGVVATGENGEEVFTISQKIGIATNNIAEWSALLEASRELKKRNIDQVDIYLDSELVVKQMKGVYKVKNEELKKLKAQVVKELEKINWTIQHIPREKNSKADKLANLAFD